MKTEQKILKHLIENKGRYTIRQVSKNIGSDYRITHTAANRLIEKGLLNTETIGKSKAISLSGRFSGEVFSVEYERQRRTLKNKDLKVIVEDLKKVSANLTVLLFGSHAKGTSTKHSDIDLMIIVPHQSMKKRIENALSLLPFSVHDFIFTEKEFQDMRFGKPNVVHEAIKNNVILYGIEGYYELLR
jgi:predicted nucleotidyltransferase